MTHKKKAIILSMSCNREWWINEEEIIRKTWGKEIINKKYDNLDLYFYRGGANENYIDIEKHIIYLKSPDDLFSTYQKSIDVFKFLIDENIYFDYIIRTNTSTYINIDACLQFLNLDYPDDIICGPHLVINNFNNWIPYLGGHFLIIPKKIINDFIIYKCDDQKIDDCGFGKSLFLKYGNEFLKKHCREVDNITSLKEPYFDKLNKSYCVRIKDEQNRENNIVNMIGLHIIYNTKDIKTKIEPPHNFTKINTSYGKIPI